MDSSILGSPVLHHLPELAQTHVHWVSDAIQPFHPLSSPSPLAFSLSQHQGLFKWAGSSHQVAIALELQHQSFQWIFRTDFLRIDWFDILAVQGTLKSLLQHHSSKTSILWYSAFFMFQLLDPHMTTGKIIALTVGTFIIKVISLVFNTLFRFGLVWYPCSPRDSHESSPTPQFKSVHSLELSLLCGPTLTSVHDYWKKP